MEFTKDLDKANIKVNRRLICIISLLFIFQFISDGSQTARRHIFTIKHYILYGIRTLFYFILSFCTNQVKKNCKNVTFRVGCIK